MHCARVLLVAFTGFLHSTVRSQASEETSDTKGTLTSGLPNHVASTQKTPIESVNRSLEEYCGKDHKKFFNIDIKSSWRCKEGTFQFNGKQPKPKFCDNKKFSNHCKDTCRVCKGKKKSECKDKKSKITINFKDWPVQCQEGKWSNGSIRADFCKLKKFRSKCPQTCKVKCDPLGEEPITSEPSTPPSSSPSVSRSPSSPPTKRPTIPTHSPIASPMIVPTLAPSTSPTKAPSKKPTMSPTLAPTKYPSNKPSLAPTISPMPSTIPSMAPSTSSNPSSVPTETCISAKFTITTDRFPYEIAWTLNDETSDKFIDKVNFKDGNYTKFKTYEHEWSCLSCHDYNFTILDYAGDGLCHLPLPEDPCGSYKLVVNNIEIANDKNFKTVDSVSFKCNE